MNPYLAGLLKAVAAVVATGVLTATTVYSQANLRVALIAGVGSMASMTLTLLGVQGAVSFHQSLKSVQ